MGYVMNAVTDWAGGPERLRRLRVRFLGNVLAGHHLRVRATVTALREEDGARLADCDVVLEVVGGDPVVSGSATVVLS
jgi:acyl dehydratase